MATEDTQAFGATFISHSFQEAVPEGEPGLEAGCHCHFSRGLIETRHLENHSLHLPEESCLVPFDITFVVFQTCP